MIKVTKPRTRSPHRIIYTSSPDRGLEHLLKIWPEIRKAVPDAELEVFYGFQLFDKFHQGNPASKAWKERIVKLLGQEGISKHGRLPQHELEQEMRVCGIWAYPAHFEEINCISALKAQAFGCVPIVTSYAALETSVQFGIKIDCDILLEEGRDLFKEHLIWLLQHPEWQEEIRKPMMEWGSSITWDKVAAQWKNEFEGKPTEPIITKPKGAIVKNVNWDGGVSNE